MWGFANLLVEIPHEDHIMAVAAEIGDKGAEVCDENFSRIRIRTAFKAKHSSLLRISSGAAGRAGFLGDLVNGAYYHTFVTSAHQ